jgi:hypothetical protein
VGSDNKRRAQSHRGRPPGPPGYWDALNHEEQRAATELIAAGAITTCHDLAKPPSAISAFRVST